MYNHWKKNDTPQFQKARKTCARCGEGDKRCCCQTIAGEQNGLTRCLQTECPTAVLGPLPPEVNGFPFRGNQDERTKAAQGLCCFGRFGNDPRTNPLF
jgi:hypothetical protein